MLYFKLYDNEVVAISEHIGAAADQWTGRWSLKTMTQAERLAAKATKFANKLYVATDAGSNTSPQFDVIEAPMIGNLVSREFNGDSYPAGVITKVSPTITKVTTDTGVVFRRVRKTGAWRENGCWYMTGGHTNKYNPCF